MDLEKYGGLALAAIVVAAAVIVLFTEDAEPHEAMSAVWEYPSDCCSGRDCSEIPADWIKEGRDGITVIPTGEVLAYTDTRIKVSPDGRTHWCRPPGDPNPRTICLYLRAKGS